MNKKQTVVTWVGVVFFLLCAWNPEGRQLPDIINYPDGRFLGRPRIKEGEHVFKDEGLTGLVARLSSTVVITSLAVYTLRSKTPKDERKQ